MVSPTGGASHLTDGLLERPESTFLNQYKGRSKSEEFSQEGRVVFMERAYPFP